MNAWKRLIASLFPGFAIIILAGCSNVAGMERKTNYSAPEWALGNWGDPDYDFIAYSISETRFVEVWPSGATVSWVLRTPNDDISSVISGDEWELSFSNQAFTTTFHIETQEEGASIRVNESASWSRIE